MKSPLVSILIPLYNAEDFIIETLECCVNQTYKNIEVIVVDDESKDNSYAIAMEYSKSHPQVKIYKQVNSGACRARNFAFEKSVGDYVIYLDADDLISTQFVEQHISVLRKTDGNCMSFCSWGKFANSTDKCNFFDIGIYRDYPHGFDLLLDMWDRGVMLQTSCYMTPRKLVIQSGGWDESVIKNQDGDFFSRVLVLSKDVKYVPDVKVYYRTGNYASVSRNMSEAAASSILYTLCSYRNTIFTYENSKRTRSILSMKYTNFIYIYGNLYPIFII